MEYPGQCNLHRSRLVLRGDLLGVPNATFSASKYLITLERHGFDWTLGQPDQEAFTAGGMLAAVVGAVAALPFVAAYPALERLWLSPTLPRNYDCPLRIIAAKPGAWQISDCQAN